MRRAGDSLLVGLSGGKDSYSLLRLLLLVRRRSPVPFSITAATVDPGAAEYDPSGIGAICADLGVKHVLVREPLISRAETCMKQGKASICSFCARMKRGILYSTCSDHGCNVLVLGQHLDDLAESFLMSAMHNGRLGTMKVIL